MPLVVVLVVLVLAAAGIAVWALTRSAPTPVAAAIAPPRSASPECVAIDRAYNAWDSPLFLPPNRAGVQELTDRQLEMLADQGTDLVKAVSGYPDQPAKELAVAAATLPVELGFARIQLIGDGVDDDQAGKVIDAIDDIRTAYREWRTATCL